AHDDLPAPARAAPRGGRRGHRGRRRRRDPARGHPGARGDGCRARVGNRHVARRDRRDVSRRSGRPHEHACVTTPWPPVPIAGPPESGEGYWAPEETMERGPRGEGGADRLEGQLAWA